ncbi:MAG: hypothetical protein QOE15_3363 [Acidimicrobiaceae bacterium]|nr:hypothetical protein [Acidimicrobiaceae bacterium]
MSAPAGARPGAKASQTGENVTNPRFSRPRLATIGASLAMLVLTLAGCGGSGGGGGGGGGGTTASTAKPPGAATTTVPRQPAGLGPERVPIPDGPPLGLVKTALYGQTIDDIKCEVSEQAVYHIHAHLSVFVDGQPRQVPYGIGIAPPLQVTPTPVGDFVAGGGCFYWLHTHAADGIMHIESPTQQLYTLGQFFDIWGQPLGAGQVGPAMGTLTIFVDGRPFTGDPRSIELKRHGEIQLDVGSVVAPTSIDWTATGL